MENKEMTLLDLVKIAARWIWVLVLGAIICAAVAFFYSTQVVTPLYSASSKFVIQTKDQSASSDVNDSARTVTYAQLAVGTYIDVVNTRNFAEEIAFYMNGNVKPQKLTQEAVNALICQGILADGGIFDTIKDDNGNDVPSHLKNHIVMLAEAELIPEGNKNMKVYDVVHGRMLKNSEESFKNQGIVLDSEKSKRINERLADIDTLVKDLVADGDFLNSDIYSGDTTEKVEQLKELGLGEGKSYKNHNYTAGSVRGKMSFSAAQEDSTTFSISVTSADAEEAYTIARVCEIVIGNYAEELYPGVGVIKTIENSKLNEAPINNNVVLMTLIGFIGGFLLAFVIVYIIELSDNRIKNEAELSAKTGLSVVGIIPDMNYDKGNSGYYYYSYSYDRQDS